MSLLDDINSKFMVQEVVNGKLLEKVRTLLILNDLSTSNLDGNVNDLIVEEYPFDKDLYETHMDILDWLNSINDKLKEE